jgi:hypothetical protein
MTLKLVEKDKIITYHCESQYYPLIYIIIQSITILVAVFTFSATSYAIYTVLLP